MLKSSHHQRQVLGFFEEDLRAKLVFDVYIQCFKNHNICLLGGASSVQDIINKTERLEAARNEVAKQLEECNKRVKGEEDLITGIEQSSIKVTSDANRLRDQITTLENECGKCEEDKSTKDNQIMTLREEIAHQDDLISKLQKEKKGAGEGRQRSEEDIQAMEDR